MTTTGIASPVRANFPMWRMDFNFDEAPKYWWNGQLFITQLMNNLSSPFSYSEKFFVDNVRVACGRLENPRPEKDVSTSIDQEVMHSKEHAAYSEHAKEYRVDLECLELRIKALLGDVSKTAIRKHRLVITCVPEHFTAIMAMQLLEREDLTTQTQSSEIYKLWIWHTIEENEYKNVAYDVYQKVYDDYFTRVLVMVLTTLIFFGVINQFQLDLLHRDGQLFSWRSWKHGLGILFDSRGGSFTHPLLPCLDYYWSGLHPGDCDTAKLEKYRKDKLAFVN